MSKQLLDLSSLEKSVNELVDALRYYHSDLAKKDPDLARHLMAGTIKAFEFTYEVGVKFLRRYLELSEPSAEIIDEMSFPSLIRTGNEKGLLKSDVKVWKQYRDKRNITSHTYDEKKAKEVMSVIPDFLLDAQYLLKKLQERNSA